jgi:hypothetical protein
MEPNKPKKTEEADTDPGTVSPETGSNNQEEREETGSENEIKPDREPYVDFSKLF